MAVNRVKIDISSPEKINHLVEMVSRCPENVYFVEGTTKVSAKSVVGIFSLDLTKPVTIEFNEEHQPDLLEKLSPYLISY